MSHLLLAASASAWRQQASELAAWAECRLVNRTDVWGGYVPLRYRTVGKSKVLTKPARTKRGKESLTRSHLMAHFRGYDVGDVVGLHTTSSINTCRFGAIEIDRHTEMLSAAITEAAALYWYAKACSLGFRPLLIDSDGKGGFHLLIVFTEPIPAARAYWFFRWLAADWKGQHLPRMPETFPKQPALNGKVGNWLRVVGRHHTREHWARLWDGKKWVERDAAIDVVLACTGDDPGLIPVQAGPPAPRPIRVVDALPGNPGDLVKRAWAYVCRMPDAVSGEHGHDRTFNVACELFRFGLCDNDALSLLQRFNTTKTVGGEWSEDELLHKRDDAKARVLACGEFGRRLREQRPFDQRIASALQRQTPGWRRSTLTIAPLRFGGRS